MKKLSDKQKYLNWAILAGVFFILLFFLNRYTAYTLDSDAASELVLAKHLADRGGAILSDGWWYSTELSVLAQQLSFQLMFFFTDNWHLARIGGTLLMLLLFLAAMYWFCRETGIKKSFPLMATLTLLPLSRTYFDIFLKFQYYTAYLIIGFAVFAAVLAYSRRGRSLRTLPLCLLAAALSVAAGCSGFRYLITLYVPLVLAVLCYACLNKDSEIRNRLFLSVGVATLGAFVGCALNRTVLAAKYAFFDYGSISFKAFSFDGIEKMLASLLLLLGYREGEEIFSLALLPTALSGILLLLCFGCAIYIVLRRERFDFARQIAAYFYLASVLVLMALYCLTDMQHVSYHSIQAVIHGLPLIFICLGEGENGGKLGKAAIMGVMCLALLTSALHYNDMRKEDKTRALREAAQWLAQSEYNEGYASFWIGNLAVELSNGGIDVWVWNDVGMAELEDPDMVVTWLQSKAHAQPPAKGKVFVLLTANESYYCEFTKGFGPEDIVYTTAGYTEGAIDEFVVYGFDSYDEMREKFVR